MKIIVSSKVLHKTLERISDKEVLNYSLVKDGLEFETAIDGMIWMGCETEYYRPNRDSHNVKRKFSKEQWGRIRSALKDFPEQPIVMEFDVDDEISISQCVLRFPN